MGSSFVTVLERYSQQVKAVGGKLMVAGVSTKVKGQLDRTETTSDILGPENVFVATTTSAPARGPRSPLRSVGSSRSLRQRLRRMRKTYHRRTHRWR